MPLHDICSFSQTCSLMHNMVADDTRLWLPLCEARWGAKTDLQAWLRLMTVPLGGPLTWDARQGINKSGSSNKMLKLRACGDLGVRDVHGLTTVSSYREGSTSSRGPSSSSTTVCSVPINSQDDLHADSQCPGYRKEGVSSLMSAAQVPSNRGLCSTEDTNANAPCSSTEDIHTNAPCSSIRRRLEDDSRHPTPSSCRSSPAFPLGFLMEADKSSCGMYDEVVTSSMHSAATGGQSPLCKTESLNKSDKQVDYYTSGLIAQKESSCCTEHVKGNVPDNAIGFTKLSMVDKGGSQPPMRALYRLLKSLESVAGVWRGVGAGPEGALYHIGWREDHLEAVQLVCSTPKLNPLPRASLFCLGPGHPHVVADLVGARDSHCVVKEYRRLGSTVGSGGSSAIRALPEVVEAAAAVAAGQGLSRWTKGACISSSAGFRRGGADLGNEVLLGSSPPDSFGFHLAHFMKSSVARPRSSSKRSQLKAMRASSSQAIPRIHVPIPERDGHHGHSLNVLPQTPTSHTLGSSLPTPASSIISETPWASTQKTRSASRSGSSPHPARVTTQTPPSLLAWPPAFTGLPLCTHTFMRVAQPKPSKQHPLAGLWKGLHGVHGAQVCTVHYDFQGSTAKIVATKVTGDTQIAAGMESWVVNAAPLEKPWPERELRLLAQRKRLVRIALQEAGHGNLSFEAEVEQEDSEDPLAFLQLGDTSEGDSRSDSPGLGEMNSVVGEGDFRGLEPVREAAGVEVMSIYHGRGRALRLGGQDCQWNEGRLWLYNNGNIAFLLLHTRPSLTGPAPLGRMVVDSEEDEAEDMNISIVEYMRLDGDIDVSSYPDNHRAR
ncbi:hypothetical protein CEUSTIGMA_g5904.t1 [Chlamydomonas eustigma]|uniref:F-box domain-containing protein n=1 Tax=Chlamydomonas eustigma TaxID=1157962 RepID=A0A250X5V8_9CHLO|nr:hypothetical protein CEUSTIGMA_g5904.t1 [Chlamydomonas eustigma]|eukprot:GAX78465.1 hypothetical protein CEUSTIGMA_g5904.t1 [Chlamydomonas eustigma]